MAEPTDLIVPILREICARIDDVQASTDREFAEVKRRIDKLDGRQKSFSQALAGDAVLSKMLVGDY
jgi:hypothetical protein